MSTYELTKNEAIQAMIAGGKVAHSSFSSDEWMRQAGFSYEFEDGCCCSPDEFWRFRTEGVWDTGWKAVYPGDE